MITVTVTWRDQQAAPTKEFTCTSYTFCTDDRFMRCWLVMYTGDRETARVNTSEAKIIEFSEDI